MGLPHTMSHARAQNRLQTVRDPTGRRESNPLPTPMQAPLHPGPIVRGMDKERQATLEELATHRATAEAYLRITEAEMKRLAQTYQEQRHEFFEEFLPLGRCQDMGPPWSGLHDVDKLLCNMEKYKDSWGDQLRDILEREREILDNAERDVENKGRVHVARGIRVQRERNEDLYARNSAAEKERARKVEHAQGLMTRMMQLVYGEKDEKYLRRLPEHYRELATRVQQICMKQLPVAQRVKELENLRTDPQCCLGP